MIFEPTDEYLSLYEGESIWVPSSSSLFSRQSRSDQLNKLAEPLARLREEAGPIVLGTDTALLTLDTIPISPSISYELRLRVAAEGAVNMQLTAPENFRTSFQTPNPSVLYSGPVLDDVFTKVLYSAETSLTQNASDVYGLPLLGFESNAD